MAYKMRCVKILTRLIKLAWQNLLPQIILTYYPKSQILAVFVDEILQWMTGCHNTNTKRSLHYNTSGLHGYMHNTVTNHANLSLTLTLTLSPRLAKSLLIRYHSNKLLHVIWTSHASQFGVSTLLGISK